MVSYKVTVRCNDSAVLGVEQMSKKGLAEVNILSHFAFFFTSFEGGGGGDLLQRQGDYQQ